VYHRLGLKVTLIKTLAPGPSSRRRCSLGEWSGRNDARDFQDSESGVLERCRCVALVGKSLASEGQAGGRQLHRRQDATPVTGTFCTLLGALSEKVTAALSEPVAFGVNVTEIVHVAPPAIDEPQLLVRAKLPRFVAGDRDGVEVRGMSPVL